MVETSWFRPYFVLTPCAPFQGDTAAFRPAVRRRLVAALRKYGCAPFSWGFFK